MSITIHRQPQEITPVYNQMIIAVTGSYQGEPNHQFVAGLYVNGVLASNLKIPTNPQGYGVFDIHRHVENQISYDFNPEFNGWNVATNSFATYSLQFSEEFRYEFEFIDNYFASGAYVGFKGVTGGEEPLFNVGDIIVVEQDGIPTNIEYNGIAEITGITLSGSNWLIQTNKSFGQNTPPEGGSIYLANYGLTTVTSSTTLSEQYAWNGVYDFVDFIDYDDADIIANGTTAGQWATTMPDNWCVGTESRVKFLTYRNDYNTQENLFIRSNNGTFSIAADAYTYSATNPIDTFADNGGNLQLDVSNPHGLSVGDVVEIQGAPYGYDGFREVISVETTEKFTVDTAFVGAALNGGETIRQVYNILDQNIMRIVGVGPYELITYTSSVTVVSGSLPIIDANTVTYSVWTEDYDGNKDIQEKVFKMKDWCSRYEQIQLIFLDKKGSFIPYTFNKANRHNKNITKTKYKQYYGEYAPASQNWSYNTYDRGTTTLDVRVNNTYTVNSDWVTQAESDYLMELFESPEVYWINENGVTLAIDITNTSVERKQTINEQIINYTLTFNLAQKSMKQKG